MIKNQQLAELAERVTEYIDQRRLREAITELKNHAHKVMAWEVEDRVKLTEQNYQLMLQYLTRGVNDPDRGDVYASLVADLYTLLDMLVSFVESVDDPSLYYSTIRYNKLNVRGSGLTDLWNRYLELSDKLSIFGMVADSGEGTDQKANDTEAANRRQLEAVQSQIFRYIWASQQLSSDDFSTIRRILESDLHPAALKQHIISALTLAILQQYDRRKLELLMEVYIADIDINVTSAALVGLLLGLWKYSSRPLPRRLSDRLALIKEKPHWRNDLRIAFIELIRARDTERLNRKMRDEVLPNMEKLRPNIMDKINDGSIDPEDTNAIQENPEWQDILDKSGVTEQLKELTEIQMEGGDVMMSTFSHLKNFSFFNEIANWFLPFDPENSAVVDCLQGLDFVSDLFSRAPFLCDSDKYSFMLAVSSMPKSQKDLMISQLQGQSDSIYEAMKADIDSDTRPEAMRKSVNSYIQNIYRFFKLFSRRSEFDDPFDTGVNLIAVDALAEDFNDPDLLEVVAEFYFKLRYYTDALGVFQRLEQLDNGDVSRYQKMGYCLEKEGEFVKAIEYYERADLLDTDSAWTVRRLAYCYHAIDNKDKTLQYYRRLTEMQPDNMRIAMLYGQALADVGDYAEAIRQFYKVEFLDDKSTVVWRPLAWTLFLTGDFEAAERYYQKIILDSPTPTDYLNMGHVALATGNIREAVNNYALSIQKWRLTEPFMEALDNDREALRNAGIDLSVVPLVIDAALYSLAY